MGLPLIRPGAILSGLSAEGQPIATTIVTLTEVAIRRGLFDHKLKVANSSQLRRTSGPLISEVLPPYHVNSPAYF